MTPKQRKTAVLPPAGQKSRSRLWKSGSKVISASDGGCVTMLLMSHVLFSDLCTHSLAESMLWKSPLQSLPPIVFLLEFMTAIGVPTVLVQHSSFPLWNSRGVMWIRKCHQSLLQCREENRVKFIYSFFLVDCPFKNPGKWKESDLTLEEGENKRRDEGRCLVTRRDWWQEWRKLREGEKKKSLQEDLVAPQMMSPTTTPATASSTSRMQIFFRERCW